MKLFARFMALMIYKKDIEPLLGKLCRINGINRGRFETLTDLKRRGKEQAQGP